MQEHSDGCLAGRCGGSERSRSTREAHILVGYAISPGRPWGRAAPPNKGMKQTSVEHIGRSQLIPGVRPTLELRRGLRLGDDLVQPFDDLRQFSGVCASETAADALCGERPNLADLDP